MRAQQLPAPPKVEVIAALGDAIPLRNTLSAEQLQLLAFCAANSLFRYRDLFLGLDMTVSRKYVPTVPCYLGSLTPRLQRMNNLYSNHNITTSATTVSPSLVNTIS